MGRRQRQIRTRSRGRRWRTLVDVDLMLEADGSAVPWTAETLGAMDWDSVDDGNATTMAQTFGVGMEINPNSVGSYPVDNTPDYPRIEADDLKAQTGHTTSQELRLAVWIQVDVTEANAATEVFVLELIDSSSASEFLKVGACIGSTASAERIWPMDRGNLAAGPRDRDPTHDVLVLVYEGSECQVFTGAHPGVSWPAFSDLTYQGKCMAIDAVQNVDTEARLLHQDELLCRMGVSANNTSGTFTALLKRYRIDGLDMSYEG